jgi:hypothetical protein
MAAKQADPRVIWTASIVLALLFAGFGAQLVLMEKPEDAVHIPSVDRATGSLLVRGIGFAMCLGAVLLLVPRLTWIGSVLLSAVLLGFVAIALTSGAPLQAAIPAMILISLGTLGYIRRPGGAHLNAVKKDPPPLGPPAPPPSSGSSPV